MLLSGIQSDRWRVMLIGPMDSRLKRAGMTWQRCLSSNSQTQKMDRTTPQHLLPIHPDKPYTLIGSLSLLMG